MNDAPLDMRMNKDAPLSAYNVVNEYSEFDLRKIINDYGEERFAGRIAAGICRARSESKIETTFQLSEIIKSAIPAAARVNGPHPAKRTFQAIRIEVNAELDVISPMLASAADKMISGGRIAVISFHSLEDRIIKHAFKELSTGCTCPRDFPVCACGKTPKIKEISRKPILPSDEELLENPRSRSAKLRIAEKL
jgi:16S rRNA (cytosine1402-N4)-methyltransferase